MRRNNGGKPLAGRVYRHYKGDYYLVRGIAKHSETGEKMVVYQALYGEGEIWVRPLEMFMEEVEPGKPRFELIEIESVKC